MAAKPGKAVKAVSKYRQGMCPYSVTVPVDFPKLARIGAAMHGLPIGQYIADLVFRDVEAFRTAVAKQRHPLDRPFAGGDV